MLQTDFDLKQGEAIELAPLYNIAYVVNGPILLPRPVKANDMQKILTLQMQVADR